VGAEGIEPLSVDDPTSGSEAPKSIESITPVAGNGAERRAKAVTKTDKDPSNPSERVNETEPSTTVEPLRAVESLRSSDAGSVDGRKAIESEMIAEGTIAGEIRGSREWIKEWV
jgi:hypothetical protein